MPELTAATSLAEIVRAVPGSRTDPRIVRPRLLLRRRSGRSPMPAATATSPQRRSCGGCNRSIRSRQPDWASMTPDALVDHLEATHHAYLHAELPRLSALADKVAAVHGTRHPELSGVRRAYETIRADLEPHLAKEERVLFPMIRELGRRPTTAPAFHCGTVAEPDLGDAERARPGRRAPRRRCGA